MTENASSTADPLTANSAEALPLAGIAAAVNVLPEQVRGLAGPILAKYGPALAAMTAAEVRAWLDHLLAGDVDAAWRTVLSRLDNAALLAAWGDVRSQWQAANEANSARMELQRQATIAVLKVLLMAALAMVGL